MKISLVITYAKDAESAQSTGDTLHGMEGEGLVLRTDDAHAGGIRPRFGIAVEALGHLGTVGSNFRFGSLSDLLYKASGLQIPHGADEGRKIAIESLAAAFTIGPLSYVSPPLTGQWTEECTCQAEEDYNDADPFSVINPVQRRRNS